MEIARPDRAGHAVEQVPTQTRLEQVEEPRVQVYVWDLPVRVTHWVNVFSILVLSVTGYYIANPLISTRASSNPNLQYLMSTIRFVHVTTAFVFTVSVLFRVYWAFRGTKYARWRQFLPVDRTRRRAFGKMRARHRRSA